MRKPLTEVFVDAPAPKKKKRRAAKLVPDYREFLEPPVEIAELCPHSSRRTPRQGCSQCLGAVVERAKAGPVVPMDDDE